MSTVQIGSKVTWHELPLNRKYTMRVVKAAQMKPDMIGKAIPANSPVAKVIIGRAVGDVVEVDTPVGVKTITIQEVN